MDNPSSDVAFTPAVKAVQSARGSRSAYQRLEQRGGFETEVTAGLAAFIAGLESFYLATANAQGQPYVQHRGGPKGFLQVLDAKTLAFADFAGNRQYVTTGNLAENDRAFLFLMDYQNQQRIKIWGRAKVSADPLLLARLMPEGYPARPEQAIVLRLEAWDANCPQHIPHLVPAERVDALLRENAALRAALKKAGLEAGMVIPTSPSPTTRMDGHRGHGFFSAGSEIVANSGEPRTQMREVLDPAEDGRGPARFTVTHRSDASRRSPRRAEGLAEWRQRRPWPR